MESGKSNTGLLNQQVLDPERQKLHQIHSFLQQCLVNQNENLEEAVKIANTHFWLNKNAEKLSKMFFSFQRIQSQLNDFDPEMASQILNDENYGPIENRANLVIEFILDKIILGVDLEIKELFVQEEQHEQVCMPFIEYATNIFPDVNLFMIYPDLDIPNNVQEIVQGVQKKICETSEEELRKNITQFFQEAWPIYQKNMLYLKKQLDQGKPLDEDLVIQFYKGEEGQCYPSNKRNPIAQFPIF